MGKIVSVNISRAKGTPKSPVDEIELVPDMGVRGDAHAGPGDRQVSLLMEESIDKARRALAGKEECRAAKGVELGPGAFAENITTSGIDLLTLRPGDEVVLQGGARIRITRIGKECHTRCAIYYKTGDCIMPAEGVFGEVIGGGWARPGDGIEKG